MENNKSTIPDQTWTVAQVLSVHPQSTHIFIQLKTSCVGCILSRFCTLEEVAKAYALKPEQVTELLDQITHLSPSKE